MIEKTPADRVSNLLAVLLILTTLLLWEASVHLNGIPVYLLPAPSRVLWTLARQPLYYLQASGMTLLEAFAGLLLGAMFGMGLAILLNLAPRLERGMMSLAILIKSTPLAAIAPLLTIWFGFGMLPKVIITALLTFFPTLVNVLVGLQSAERELIDLMHVHGATRWQVLRHLKLYLALPYLFAALRVVAPLSLVGAVVAEWSGASGGLGRIMWLAYANLNLPAMFAAIFILSACGMIAYLLIVTIEQRLLRWR